MKYDILVQTFTFKEKEKQKKIVAGPLSHKGREGKTLVVRPLKKTFFMCVLGKLHLEPLERWKVEKRVPKKFFLFLMTRPFTPPPPPY